MQGVASEGVENHAEKVWCIELIKTFSWCPYFLPEKLVHCFEKCPLAAQ